MGAFVVELAVGVGLVGDGLLAVADGLVVAVRAAARAGVAVADAVGVGDAEADGEVELEAVGLAELVGVEVGQSPLGVGRTPTDVSSSLGVGDSSQLAVVLGSVTVGHGVVAVDVGVVVDVVGVTVTVTVVEADG